MAAGAAFVAVGAAVGTVGLALGWLSFGDRLNARLPFASPLLAAFALFVFVAVPFTVLAGRAWRGDASTGSTAIVVGAGLVLWIVVQLAFLREFSAFQPVYAALGVVFVVAGRRVRAARVPDVDVPTVERFLAEPRIVMIGATDDRKKFGRAVYRAFVDHGHDVVPVNPHRTTIDGVPCLPDLRSVQGEVDAVIVMLTGPAAYDAVRECVLRDVSMVWLFRGVGGPGAWSPEAVSLCHEHGVAVIAGACPLMFLGPVTGAHHAHLVVRRFSHAVV
jgi:predicted CoA-binding protein